MIVIIMGVVGAGKTTVGTLLANQLGWQFADADDFHPATNIEKIRQGIPLTDADRDPWLESLSHTIEGWIAANENAVLACSALKRSYREKLSVAPEVRFVYLKGSPGLIAGRLHARHGHFAGESILTSQIADLEEPEVAIVADIRQDPLQIVDSIRKQLGLG
jgi:gluconokinase